jgi:hypothetical protein
VEGRDPDPGVGVVGHGDGVVHGIGVDQVVEEATAAFADCRALVVQSGTVTASAVPFTREVTPASVDALRHGSDPLRERCLLFVVCTRAREVLAVSWSGTASPFVPRGRGGQEGARSAEVTSLSGEGGPP